MAEPQPERRSSRRFALRLPLTVTYPDGPQDGVESESRDVSARGICFYFESARPRVQILSSLSCCPPEDYRDR